MVESKILASSIGVSVAEILTLPICTIKTQYQQGSVVSIKDSIREIYNRSGILGFYRASVPAVSLQIFNSTYKVSMFETIRREYNLNSTKNLIIAGMFSSVSCVILVHPIDYLRACLQVGNKPRLNNCYTGLSQALYKGFLAGGLYLPLRRILMEKYSDMESWKIGIISAAVSTTIVQPFDYFKNYLMTNKKGSVINLKKAYRGYSLNMARVIPHFVIMTEITDKLLDKPV